MTRRPHAIVLRLLVCLPLLWLAVGCQASRFSSTDDAYAYRDVAPPRGDRIVLVSGYTARFKHPQVLGGAEHRELATYFEPAPESAEAERRQVGLAIAWFERWTGERIGTDQDKPGTMAGTFADGQLNCVDESLNLTTYLLVMEADGLLRYHTPQPPTQRMNLAVGKLPHWTAVLREDATSVDWAYDSYFHLNGEPPEIQPLADWFRFERTKRYPY